MRIAREARRVQEINLEWHKHPAGNAFRGECFQCAVDLVARFTAAGFDATWQAGGYTWDEDEDDEPHIWAVVELEDGAVIVDISADQFHEGESRYRVVVEDIDHWRYFPG